MAEARLRRNLSRQTPTLYVLYTYILIYVHIEYSPTIDSTYDLNSKLRVMPTLFITN